MPSIHLYNVYNKLILIKLYAIKNSTKTLVLSHKSPGFTKCEMVLDKKNEGINVMIFIKTLFVQPCSCIQTIPRGGTLIKIVKHRYQYRRTFHTTSCKMLSAFSLEDQNGHGAKHARMVSRHVSCRKKEINVFPKCVQHADKSTVEKIIRV